MLVPLKLVLNYFKWKQKKNKLVLEIMQWRPWKYLVMDKVQTWLTWLLFKKNTTNILNHHFFDVVKITL